MICDLTLNPKNPQILDPKQMNHMRLTISGVMSLDLQTCTHLRMALEQNTSLWSCGTLICGTTLSGSSSSS